MCINDEQVKTRKQAIWTFWRGLYDIYHLFNVGLEKYFSPSESHCCTLAVM